MILCASRARYVLLLGFAALSATSDHHGRAATT